MWKHLAPLIVIAFIGLLCWILVMGKLFGNH